MENKDKYAIQDKLFRQKHVIEYLQEKWKAELHNRDSFLSLWEVYETEIDTQRKHALEVKMAQFRKAIINTQNPYSALMLDFTKYKFSDKTETVDWSEWKHLII